MKTIAPPSSLVIIACLNFLALPAYSNNDIEEVTINASRVANTTPATSLSSIATALSYDPQVELYSRGLAEGQSDITVRGSMFESTSVKIGAVVLMDPQTGHYTANLPISPAFLNFNGVLTGAQNAIEGFNATVATLHYDLDIRPSTKRINLSAGSDAFKAASMIYTASLSPSVTIGTAIERSEGDGTVRFGDHAFQRLNLAIQHNTATTTSQLVLASQHTFFGWPGAYTGFASLPETDHTDTDLLLINHSQQNADGDISIAGYYRRVVDNYDFDRRSYETGTAGAFEHETASWGFAVEGNRKHLHYRAQLTGDALIASTDLTHGFFNTRQYLSSSIGYRDRQRLTDGTLITDIGLTADISNRDSNRIQPYAYAEWQTQHQWATFIDYARTSQLPGYTALNSNATGLFGGNPLLSRESAEQLEIGMRRIFSHGEIEASVFWRDEQDVVDWTFSSQSPFARQANPMDNQVTGLHIHANTQGPNYWLSTGLTWLSKDFNYQADNVDASYYALNYANIRATLSVIYTLSHSLSLHVDSEYRQQAVNRLRTSSAEAFFGRIATVWNASAHHQFSITVDNISDDDFQMYPGTPGIGRSASLAYEFIW
ncbi:MAG TPA: TonB-dependent receptor [Pseudomonadales bacterium]|nr:TonB-dependent receptor [Pseudomonadales bacterium]